MLPVWEVRVRSFHTGRDGQISKKAGLACGRSGDVADSAILGNLVFMLARMLFVGSCARRAMNLDVATM